jgi:hypothetical protein
MYIDVYSYIVYKKYILVLPVLCFATCYGNTPSSPIPVLPATMAAEELVLGLKVFDPSMFVSREYGNPLVLTTDF